MTKSRSTTAKTGNQSPSRRGLEMEYKVGYSATGYYKSASLASTDGVSWVTASGDYALSTDRQTLIEISRHFYRNNPIYQGMIDRAAAYIVGSGFGLQMRSKSESYNEKVESLWKDWWEWPEVRRINPGEVVGRMNCTELLQTGASLSLKLDSGDLQQLEIEQCCGKSWKTDGIKKDAVGTPKTFTVYPYANTGQLDMGKGQEVSAQNILFVANRTRPSQTHGVPPLQTTFSNLHRINDVCDSEAISWQAQSRLFLINNRDPASPQYGESVADATAADGTLAPRITYLGQALIFNAAIGETLQAIERKIPGQSFPESLRMFLRILGLPFGMPLELILLDWTQSNFSQSRAVLEQVYQVFLYWQKLLELQFYRPLINWKIDQWTRDGLIQSRSKDGYRHEWIKPSFPWINLMEEAKANGEKVERAFTTHSAICKSLQSERSEICDLREAEIRDAIARAQRIEADTQVKVPWEYFAGLKIQPGQQTEPAAAPNETKTDQKNDTE